MMTNFTPCLPDRVLRLCLNRKSLWASARFAHNRVLCRLLYSVDVSFLRRTQSLVAAASFCWTFAAAVWAQAPKAAPTGAQLQFYPLSDVKRGLHGVAYTVFEGSTPEPMDVEILGLLRDAIGPKQDMILARLHGTKAEYTGVVAGMSGSPVYIDGRLVGALSFRIGQFSKEPIAGITPIAEMLEVRDGVPQPMGAPKSGQAHPAAGESMRPIETPLVFSGFSQETVDRFADRFTALGLVPVSGLGGSAPNAAPTGGPLVPGSAVSAVLVEGDLSVAGTCTVTYVDPKRLLACGHPITQYGSISMPMTKADVLTTLASPLNSFKIVNTTETVGAFTEDRQSAILGRFGETARMIPVTVKLRPTGRPETEQTYHFRVLDNRQLTPSAVLVSIYQTLQGTNVSAAELSYRLHGTMTVERATDEITTPPAQLGPGMEGPGFGTKTVRLDGVMTQGDFNPAAISAAIYVNERFSRIYDSAAEQPRITGLDLEVEVMRGQRSAAIEGAQAALAEVSPGETLEISAVLHPFREAAQPVRLSVRVPATVSRGPLRLLVSDGATLDRLTAGTSAGQHAATLADAVRQLNATHDNDRIYVTVLDRETQAVLPAGALSEVPLSMANVLQPSKETRGVQLNGESLVTLTSEKTDYAVSGAQVIELQVR